MRVIIGKLKLCRDFEYYLNHSISDDFKNRIINDILRATKDTFRKPKSTVQICDSKGQYVYLVRRKKRRFQVLDCQVASLNFVNELMIENRTKELDNEFIFFG